MKCKECGTKVHYCTSCDPDDILENGYCSQKCWESSEEYKETKINFIFFWKSLNDEQKEFVNTYIYNMVETYQYEIDTWIKSV